MKKNVSGQKIGAQMITAADGTAFTGSVTVSVTGDAGTQATGSVGSGACTHEGNGYHTYAPAQAETNYDLVAFTFTGTGAIPATVQVFTSFPQTVDNATNIADIQTRLPAALVSGRMDSSVGAMAANVLTATAINADAITAAKLAADVTTELQSGLATAANLATVAGYLDTEIAAILEDTGTTIPAQISALNNLSAAQVNAEVDTAISDAALATAANLATAQTAITAIKAKTDSLTFTVAGQVDANIQSINDVTIVGDGSGTPFNV